MLSPELEAAPSPQLKWPSLWSVAGVLLVAFGALAMVAVMVLSSTYAHGVPDQLDVGKVVVLDMGFQVFLGVLTWRLLTKRNGDQPSAVRTFLVRLEPDDRALLLKLVPLVLVANVAALGLIELLGLSTDLSPLTLEALTHPLSVVVAFTLVPVAEELFCRGALYGALLRWGDRVALIGTFLISSLMHWPPAHVVGVLPSMALLTWLRWRTGRLAPSVIAHAILNALVMGVALLLGP